MSGRRPAGLVSLVGAGPGHPELLTLAAAERLRAADEVLHDGLVPRALLRLAPTAAHRLVSRRPRGTRVSQATVVQWMIRAARRGRRVVRLKCGDPFVFGRGGEEAVALRAADVRVEIVPGLTTAVAAPGLAGIPLTHRGVSSSFVVVSGHRPAAYEPVLAGLGPNSATVVVLMGSATRARLGAFLLERGWRPATPAAVVTAASRRAQALRVGTLASLARQRRRRYPVHPVVIVIGDVVGLAGTIGR